MVYRPEIDGLRALAVLSVIFYHAGFSIVPGGFSGVDVFFVISGFLLTAILVKEKQTETYSLLGFYNRRVRRLLPALYSILIFCIFIGFIFFKPKDFNLFANSIIPSLGMFANIFFKDNINYFSPSIDTSPLIHVWSLSVEEQFYLVFPLIISCCFLMKKHYKSALLIAVLQLTFMSFMIMQLAQSQNLTNWAFFMMPARGWELLLGALGALAYPHLTTLPRWFRSTLSVFGLTLILYSIFFIIAATPWPTKETLIPTIGTLIFLCFSSKDLPIIKLITKKPIVSIGLVSYSLYLWHQPLLALSRTIYIGEPNKWVMMISIVVAIILSYITYYFIEKPFRKKSFISNKCFYAALCTIGILICSVGAYLSSLDGAKFRYLNEDAKSFNVEKRYPECISTIGDEKPPGDKRCHLNKDKGVEWATLGDSHSDSFAKALAERFPESGVQEFAKSLCGPAINFDTSSFDGCKSWLSVSKEKIISNKNITKVLIVYRHSYYIKGEHTSLSPSVNISHLSGERIDNPKEAYLASFKLLIDELVSHGKEVYIVEPTPELKDDIEDLYLPLWIGGVSPRVNPIESLSITDYKKRNHWITSWLREQTGIHIVKVTDTICSEDYCPYVFNNTPGYFDSDHITPYVAKLIINEI